MPLDVNPFGRARRGLPRERTWRRFFDAVHRVRLQHTDPVARAENGTDVVRVVDIFQHDRQIWLTPRQHGPDARLPSLGSRPTPGLQGLRSGQCLPVRGLGAFTSPSTSGHAAATPV